MSDPTVQYPAPDAGAATWDTPTGPVGGGPVPSLAPPRHVMVTAVSVALIICGALTALVSVARMFQYLTPVVVEIWGRAGIGAMIGLGVLLGAVMLVAGVVGLGAPARPSRVPAVVALAVVAIVLSCLVPFVSSFIIVGGLTHPTDPAVGRSIVLQALLSVVGSAAGILLPVLLIVGARDLARSATRQPWGASRSR